MDWLLSHHVSAADEVCVCVVSGTQHLLVMVSVLGVMAREHVEG